MSTLELKAFLHQIIANADDENWLKDLLAWVNRNKVQENSADASPEVLKAIEEGILDISNGNVISHDEMKRKYSKWLQE